MKSLTRTQSESSTDSFTVFTVRSCGGVHQTTVSDVAFQDVKLSLKLKDRDLTILHGISGYFSSRTVTAILGPSGCGKSSLLDIISMRKTIGEVSGKFELAGVRMTKEHVHQSMGYVEQKHALLEYLTVKEHFQYVAALKLSKESPAEQERAVEHTLANLELSHRKNTIIQGNERGLSGGEQKRVAVGIAMLTRPRVLLLDEPTSGLDSIASLGIFHLLAKLSNEGIAVACTVHSPHNSAFATFDNLMLLLGGRMAYFGPCRDEELRQHFEGPDEEEDIFQLKPPPGLAVNPSFAFGMPDIQRLDERALECEVSMAKMSKIVDRMNGSLGIVDRVLMAGNDAAAALKYEEKFKKSRLFQNIPPLLDLDGKTNIKVDRTSKLSKTSRVDSSLDMGTYTPGYESTGPAHSLNGVDKFTEMLKKSEQDLSCPEVVQCSFLKSIEVLFVYTVLVKLTSLRYWMERAMDKGPPILIFSVIAASMGRREDNVQEVTFFIMSIVGFLAFVAKNEIMASMITERPVFERERSEGLYKPEVYTMMVILKELPIWTLTALWHVAIPYLIFGLRGSLLAHCGTAIVLTIACGIFTALAAAISRNVPMGNIVFDAYILGMLVPTQGALFRIKAMPAFIRWVHYINPLYYAFASHMKIEQEVRGVAGQTLLDFYGLAGVKPQTCIAMICAFALLYFVLLALSLRFINHQKR